MNIIYYICFFIDIIIFLYSVNIYLNLNNAPKELYLLFIIRIFYFYLNPNYNHVKHSMKGTGQPFGADPFQVKAVVFVFEN